MAARRSHQKRLTRHSILSRLVAGLLLVFVIYGTTIEAAHRHGRIFNSELSKSTSITSDDDTQGLAGSSRSCAECLICQLHQHFSASLVTVRDSDAPAQTASGLECEAPFVVDGSPRFHLLMRLEPPRLRFALR